MRAMHGVDFSLANAVLRGEHLGAYDLHVRRTKTHVVSCWEVIEDVLIDIQLQRKVYLAVCGSTHPPLLLGTDLKEGDL